MRGCLAKEIAAWVKLAANASYTAAKTATAAAETGARMNWGSSGAFRCRPFRNVRLGFNLKCLPHYKKLQAKGSPT